MNMQVLDARRDVSGGYTVDVSRSSHKGRVSSLIDGNSAFSVYRTKQKQNVGEIIRENPRPSRS